MSRSGGVAPEVCVVVAAHDDADRLTRAVASVRAQSLDALEILVVDDASTDGTGEVARALAAEDARVSAIVLERNTGSAGGPRNAGLAASSAPWVMFLDSDDELEPDACRVLLEAGHAHDAEVVAALTVRRVAGSDRERPWLPELFETTRLVDGAREVPELFFDSISTNKLYRRDFLERHALTFAEGVLYEDNLWTAQVSTLVRRLALIPDRIYTWHVEPEGEKLSVTNRRHEFANFRDRIRTNRQIDAFLAAHGDPVLQVAKDVKFLSSDLRLYLKQLHWRDRDYQERLVELGGEYVRGIGDDALALVPPATRVAVYMLRTGDLPGLLAATDLMSPGSKPVNRLERTPDGRVRWALGTAGEPAPEPDPQLAWLLDLTDVFGAEETEAWVPYVEARLVPATTDGTLGLDLTIHDRLDHLGEGARLDLSLVVRERETKREHARRRTLALGSATVRGGVATWTGAVDLASAVPMFMKAEHVGVAVRISRDGERLKAPLSVLPAEIGALAPVEAQPAGASGVGVRLEPYVTRNRNLAFEAVRYEGWLAPARRRLSRLAGRSR